MKFFNYLYYSNKKKIVSLILLSAIISIPLFACGKNTENVSNTTQATQSQNENSTESSDPNARIPTGLPDMDFEGYTFTMYANSIMGVNDISQRHRDLDAEEVTGEVINDAVFERNRAVEDKYNLNIRQELIPDDTFMTSLKKQINSGTAEFDVVFFIMRNYNELMTGGFLNNMFELEYVDFEKPWWDKDSVNALSLDNKLGAVNSAITIVDNMGAQALIFNKNLARDYNVENMYDLVKGNKWTLDKFGEIARSVSKDLNGDGQMDENDLWGFIFQRDTLSSFTNGSNVYIAQKDSNDYPVITFDGERQYTVYDKIFDILYDQSTSLNVHKEYEARGDWDVTMNRMFQNNQGLFMWIRLRDCESLRTMETDFGILPIPKYNEQQERYLTSINPHTSGIMGLPRSNIEMERTGFILEALAAESLYTVQPAYYDITLQGKVTRDEESSDMLDIIINNRSYDLGDILVIAGFDQYIYETMTLQRDMVTFYEKRIGKAEKEIEKMMDKISQLD